jgi:A/G-specific adenine glycosylase
MERLRARGLSKLGKILATEFGGKIPTDKELLLELPNVGPYTANAFLCMAYGEQLPMVDTNTVRVVTRVFSHRSARKRAYSDPAFWRMVASLIPKNRARSFNLAMIDLGASLCLHKNPLCSVCPLVTICNYGKGRMDSTN